MHDLDLPDGVLARSRLADDLEAVQPREDGGQTVADDGMVADRNDAYGPVPIIHPARGV